ncbi:MAG: hypothetical protein C5B59_15755 [Bacteroidetes bacterium]|nr:MAG: hypothetical protein C5B59_15755 [Bacteroidota bacterium]
MKIPHIIGVDLSKKTIDLANYQLKTSDLDDSCTIMRMKFYTSADVNTKQFFIPDNGPVKNSCTDDKGRNKNILD